MILQTFFHPCNVISNVIYDKQFIVIRIIVILFIYIFLEISATVICIFSLVP